MNNAQKQTFVPLSTAPAAPRDRAEFKVTVLKQGQESEPAFQALGRPAGAVHGSSACEPQVTLQREGDRVSTIRIQCTCGQVIELACDYKLA